MLAAVLKGVNELVLEDVPKPEPGPTQVVVAVKACGICATDHKAVRGKREVQFPRILGHEIAGVIDSVGSAARRYRPGDEVIISPRGYCGLCEPCRLGRYHYCEETFSTGGDGGERFLPGGFAQFMCTDEHNAFSKPPEISFPAAALSEPLAGAWKGVIQYSQLQIGEDVVVIGTGGIGLLCLMVAHKAGAGTPRRRGPLRLCTPQRAAPGRDPRLGPLARRRSPGSVQDHAPADPILLSKRRGPWRPSSGCSPCAAGAPG